jgi:hypothetical protein
MPLFESVTDLQSQAEVIRRRRYGVIEVADGQFRAIRFRPFPKWITILGIKLGAWRHRKQTGDRCLLYFNQPRQFSNFIALRYIYSTAGASYRTFHTALAALDEVARIKRTDALLCDVANARVSDRMMRRWGWEGHKPQAFHRNYIKRFYGQYPPPAAAFGEAVRQQAISV